MNAVRSGRFFWGGSPLAARPSMVDAAVCPGHAAGPGVHDHGPGSHATSTTEDVSCGDFALHVESHPSHAHGHDPDPCPACQFRTQNLACRDAEPVDGGSPWSLPPNSPECSRGPPRSSGRPAGPLRTPEATPRSPLATRPGPARPRVTQLHRRRRSPLYPARHVPAARPRDGRRRAPSRGSFHAHPSPQSRPSARRLHADRVAGGDLHHRRPDRPAPARRAGRPRGRPVARPASTT